MRNGGWEGGREGAKVKAWRRRERSTSGQLEWDPNYPLRIRGCCTAGAGVQTPDTSSRRDSTPGKPGRNLHNMVAAVGESRATRMAGPRQPPLRLPPSSMSWGSRRRLATTLMYTNQHKTRKRQPALQLTAECSAAAASNTFRTRCSPFPSTFCPATLSNNAPGSSTAARPPSPA